MKTNEEPLCIKNALNLKLEILQCPSSSSSPIQGHTGIWRVSQVCGVREEVGENPWKPRKNEETPNRAPCWLVIQTQETELTVTPPPQNIVAFLSSVLALI